MTEQEYEQMVEKITPASRMSQVFSFRDKYKYMFLSDQQNQYTYHAMWLGNTLRASHVLKNLHIRDFLILFAGWM
jgi:hypothetical protein